MLKKIETELANYETSDQVDTWKMEVGEYYGNKTFAQIKAIHDQLVTVGKNVEKIRLLTFFERGSMYAFLKASPPRFGRWIEVCNDLNVYRRTVDRYIDFSK